MTEPSSERDPFRLLPRQAGLIADPIVQCFALILLTSAFFLLFPGIDLWFSQIFYRAGDGFTAGHLLPFMVFRNLHRWATFFIPAALVVVLVLKLARPWRRSRVSPRDTLFILSTLAIGPGLIVNLVLKNHWGRPRPTTVSEFLGDNPFVGVWQITDYCASNCSFVSGEASSAMWLLTLLVLVPPASRRFWTKVLVVLAVTLSLNRIAFGGHFLSDVLLSWWITLAVMAAIWRLLYENPPAALTEERLEDGLTSAGLVLRKLFGRA